MSIGNLILGASSVTVSYLIHFDSLLQNATDNITKCDSYFIKKCENYKNVLQNATVITNCDNFIIRSPRNFSSLSAPRAQMKNMSSMYLNYTKG